MIMNRFMILLILLFVSFAKSIPFTLQTRQDSLGGFKQCKGKFPNKITAHSYSPDPMVDGEPMKVHLAGKATVVVEKGALLTLTGYYKNQLTFIYGVDYCKGVVEPSGFECPVGKGDFSYTTNAGGNYKSTDTKNATLEYDLQMTVSNPDGQVLSCIERKLRVIYP